MFVYQFESNNFIDYNISEAFDNIIKTNNRDYGSNAKIIMFHLGYSPVCESQKEPLRR